VYKNFELYNILHAVWSVLM